MAKQAKTQRPWSLPQASSKQTNRAFQVQWITTMHMHYLFQIKLPDNQNGHLCCFFAIPKYLDLAVCLSALRQHAEQTQPLQPCNMQTRFLGPRLGAALCMLSIRTLTMALRPKSPTFGGATGIYISGFIDKTGTHLRNSSVRGTVSKTTDSIHTKCRCDDQQNVIRALSFQCVSGSVKYEACTKTHLNRR